MSGTCASMPNLADPSILWTTSMRGIGLPRKVNWSGVLMAGSWASLILAASAASSPNRSGRDQALACAGADLLHLLLGSAYGTAAVREHVAIDLVLADVTVGRGVFDPNLRPIAVQFLRYDHGQRRHAALAHLRALIPDQDGVVRVDRDPRVDFVRRIGVVVIPGLRHHAGRLGARRGADTDGEAAGGSRRRD